MRPLRPRKSLRILVVSFQAWPWSPVMMSNLIWDLGTTCASAGWARLTWAASGWLKAATIKAASTHGPRRREKHVERAMALPAPWLNDGIRRVLILLRA